MNTEQYNEILAMLVALYKKVDDLEHKNRMRLASDDTYLEELRRLADRIYLK